VVRLDKGQADGRAGSSTVMSGDSIVKRSHIYTDSGSFVRFDVKVQSKILVRIFNVNPDKAGRCIP